MAQRHRLLFALSLLANFLTVISACGRGYPMPRWDGEFWAADHERQELVIARPGETERRIRTSDPIFSQGYWLHEQALACLYQQVVMNCERFKEKQPKCDPVRPAVIQQFVEKANAQYHRR